MQLNHVLEKPSKRKNILIKMIRYMFFYLISMKIKHQKGKALRY